MGIRRFSQERLSLCQRWFEEVETTDVWTETGVVGEGESQSVRVQNGDGLNGVAKPGAALAGNETCRAAHEKIAFDLAHLLDLPVPPVVLWRDATGPSFQRGRCISAWAFQHLMKWSTAEATGILTPEMMDSAAEAISAMRVFHTWIADTDRKADHIQVDIDSPANSLAVAFIDHAFAMSYVWKGPNQQAGHSGYLATPERRDVTVATIDLISSISEAEIQRLVKRVPLTYLPDAERENIIQNLMVRRGNLRAILGI